MVCQDRGGDDTSCSFVFIILLLRYCTYCTLGTCISCIGYILDIAYCVLETTSGATALQIQ